MARTTKAQLNAFIAEFNASHTVELTITEGTKRKRSSIGFTEVPTYFVGWVDEYGDTRNYYTCTKASTTNSDLLNGLKALAEELKDKVAKVEPEAPASTPDPNFDPFALFETKPEEIDLFALFTNV